MFDIIMDALRAVWDWLKRIWVKICSFLRNIVSFFKNPQRLEKIKKDKNTIAVAIKQNLDNGEFNVINCLANKETGELVNPEEDAEIIQAENLDAQTMQNFGDKDMLVLA